MFKNIFILHTHIENNIQEIFSPNMKVYLNLRIHCNDQQMFKKKITHPILQIVL